MRPRPGCVGPLISQTLTAAVCKDVDYSRYRRYCIRVFTQMKANSHAGTEAAAPIAEYARSLARRPGRPSAGTGFNE